ncbi:hypothetical protein GQ55_6G278900 [Panicum hallii var. hallii]|uniref:Ubiquitin-like protease family profile domain-containing protein n=1 Tax=Panicum hallii var. hallii TaxID=1504633 RepID=A0A2T7DAB2_9POAL|nr:hypothetical protein GQ55_6G278900 [Panicum hallii var. hallii]
MSSSKSGVSSNASTGECRPTGRLHILNSANKSDVTLLFPNFINKNYSHSSSCGLFVLKFMKLWTGSRLSSIFTQKDMTNFRLKLAVTLVDYPWNKVKESPGYKSTDVEEAYKLEDIEK